jgi:peptide subunit release factor 1 (eRF1)
MIQARHLQELVNFKTPSAEVVSLYLDIDDGRTAAQALALACKGMPNETLAAVGKDLKAIEQALGGTRAPTDRGMAVFCSSRFRLLRACPLPEPVKTRLVICDRPHLRPLLNIADQYQRYGVALVGAASARFFEFYLGRIRELPEHEIRQGDSSGGRAGLARAAAAKLESLARELQFTRVIAACVPPLRPLVVDLMHKSLHDELIVENDLDPLATAGQVAERILWSETQARRLRELVTAQRLIDGSGKDAAIGLRRALEAVEQGRVKALLVRDGFAKLGRRCAGCDRLSQGDTKCVICGAPTRTVFNLIDELCDRALDQGAQVLRLLHRTALDNVGFIGVELRSVSSLPAATPRPAGAL